MSLESKIAELTEAVNRLIAVLNSDQAPSITPAAAPVPAPPAPAPVVVPAPAPVAPPAPAMPAPPAFVAPAAPVASGAPFTDVKGLIDYVMASYKALGPQKGAEIQKVLVGLGYNNINDVKPEHYGALFQGVESLKG